MRVRYYNLKLRYKGAINAQLAVIPGGFRKFIIIRASHNNDFEKRLVPELYKYRFFFREMREKINREREISPRISGRNFSIHFLSHHPLWDDISVTSHASTAVGEIIKVKRRFGAHIITGAYCFSTKLLLLSELQHKKNNQHNFS